MENKGRIKPNPARFESHADQKWFWCPKCAQSVPQLSDKHYKGECPCEKDKTEQYVEMVLLPENDPRVVKATEWLRR